MIHLKTIYLAYTSLIEGSQGRNLEAGTETEAVKECNLLASSIGLAQFAFLCY